MDCLLEQKGNGPYNCIDCQRQGQPPADDDREDAKPAVNLHELRLPNGCAALLFTFSPSDLCKQQSQIANLDGVKDSNSEGSSYQMVMTGTRMNSGVDNAPTM